jgi:hypothetical protein
VAIKWKWGWSPYKKGEIRCRDKHRRKMIQRKTHHICVGTRPKETQWKLLTQDGGTGWGSAVEGVTLT